MDYQLIDKEIPIIILNWFGIEDTKECIDSLMLTAGVKFHIFLVDNNSGKDEQSELKQLFEHIEQITLIFNEENYGFARGNNEIIKKLLLNEKIEYVVLLNNDTVVTPSWLFNLVKSAKDNRASMVSSKMINYYDRSIMDNAGHFMLNTAEILPLAHGKSIDDFTQMFNNLGACGGAALYSSEMLREIGLFDPFFSTGYEDAELGLRANMLGYKTIFEPTAKIFHKVSRSIKKVRDDDYFIRIQRNIFYTYTKLMPTKYILVNLIWILLKYVVLFILSILTLQIRIIKLHLKTIYRFFRYDLSHAITERKKMKQFNQIQSDTVKKIEFFLKTDLRRFFQLFKYAGD